MCRAHTAGCMKAPRLTIALVSLARFSRPLPSGLVALRTKMPPLHQPCWMLIVRGMHNTTPADAPVPRRPCLSPSTTLVISACCSFPFWLCNASTLSHRSSTPGLCRSQASRCTGWRRPVRSTSTLRRGRLRGWCLCLWTHRPQGPSARASR